MEQTYYTPLSDLGRIKEKLMAVFSETESITRLVQNCYDIPYTEGAVPSQSCAIFMETQVVKTDNQHMKEVGIDISIVCHKDFTQISEADTEYLHSVGIYGNRIDSALQAVHSAIMLPENLEAIKKEFTIGNFNLAEEEPVKTCLLDNGCCGKCLCFRFAAFYRRRKER